MPAIVPMTMPAMAPLERVLGQLVEEAVDCRAVRMVLMGACQLNVNSNGGLGRGRVVRMEPWNAGMLTMVNASWMVEPRPLRR